MEERGGEYHVCRYLSRREEGSIMSVGTYGGERRGVSCL